jgi:hypothetical protein
MTAHETVYHPLRTVQRMRTAAATTARHFDYIADVVDDSVVHASLTCERNTGLVETVECHLDGYFGDPEALLAGAERLGFVVPDWVAEMMVPCRACAGHLARSAYRRAA